MSLTTEDKGTLNVMENLRGGLLGQKSGLEYERSVLLKARDRISEIDATLAVIERQLAMAEEVLDPLRAKQAEVLAREAADKAAAEAARLASEAAAKAAALVK